jgi:hypothetical protein
MKRLATVMFGVVIALTASATVAFAAPDAPTVSAPSAASAAAHYTTNGTTIGDLLADPAAKAILDKHIPGLSDNPSIAMASGITLRAIRPMA